MTSLKGYSSALKEGKIPQEDLEKTYSTIYKKSEEMDHMLNTLLEYNQINSKDNKYEKEIIDLCEELRQNLAENFNLLEKHGIRLENQIPEENIYYNLSKEDFKRISTNLLNNAIQHNDFGIQLLVELKESPHFIELSFADSGHKIEASLKDKIFDPFVKADSSRQSGQGSGLGLASVKKIVQDYGGQIKLTEPYKDYSKAFTIIFPKSRKNSYRV